MVTADETAGAADAPQQTEDSTMPRATVAKKHHKPKAKKETTVKKATKTAPAKKAAKKDTAKKQVATGEDRKSYKDDMVIKITDIERAEKMRADSRRRISFKKISNGMTVAAYIKKGGDRMDLNIMDKLGIVSVK